MRRAVAAGLSAGLAAGTRDQAQTPQTNGIAKVLEMLASMKEKAIKEAQDEKVTFAKFSQWCDDTKIELESAIKKGTAMIDEYTGAIAMNEGKSAELKSEIEAQAAEAAALTEKKNAEVARRAEEASASAKIKAEIQENIVAVGKAVEVLKAQPAAVAFNQQSMKAALVQVEAATSMSSRQKEIVSLLVTGVPAYENQSGGVVKMLEDLMDQFVAEKFKEEKEDSIKAAASDKIVTNLNGQIRLAEEDKARSEGAKAKHDAAAGKASEDKATAEDVLKSNKSNLSKTTGTCTKKHADMEVRTKTRAGEIEAIGKAAETIEGVAGLKTAAGFVQTVASFLQLSNKGQNKSVVYDSADVQEKVASLLKAAGLHQKSKRLQLLALKVEDLSGKSPFAKIMKMIEGMIMKLKKEGAEEAGKNAQCIQWMSDNKQDHDDSQERLDALNTSIEKETATVASCGEKLATLQEEKQSSIATLNKAAKNRAEEKKENAATVADAKVGSEAVDKAIQILNDFYGEAATKESFAQTGQVDVSDMPDTFDSPYQGQQSMGGGVVSIMEVILSDFLKLLQETEASEAAAQSEYDELVQSEKEAKAARDAQMAHLEKEKASSKQALTQAESDLVAEKATMSSIVEAKRVIEQDKGCVMGAGKTPDELFKERSDARKAEMESLEQALEVLKVQT